MQKLPGKKCVFTPISDEQLYANPLLYLLLVPYQQIYRSNESQPDSKSVPVTNDAKNRRKDDENDI